jgi:hypothetical protein
MTEARAVALTAAGETRTVDLEILSDEQQEVLKTALALTNGAVVDLPSYYQAAVAAIEKCDRADQAATFTSMAERISVAARQARDERLLITARRISARSWQRLGKLLLQFPSTSPGGSARLHETPEEANERRAAARDAREQTPPEMTRAAVAKAARLSDSNKKKAVEIASIPDALFDAVVDSEKSATGHQLLQIYQSLGKGRAKGLSLRNGMRAATLRMLGPVQAFVDRHRAEEVAKLFSQDAPDMAHRAERLCEYFDGLARGTVAPDIESARAMRKEFDQVLAAITNPEAKALVKSAAVLRDYFRELAKVLKS